MYNKKKRSYKSLSLYIRYFTPLHNYMNGHVNTYKDATHLFEKLFLLLALSLDLQ